MIPAKHLTDDQGNCLSSCWPCKQRSVSFAPSAMPNRNPNAARAVVKDKQLDKDREAYKRLRRNGEQPRHVEGSAHLEAISESSAEVTTGLMMTDHGKDLLDTRAHRRDFAKAFDEQPAEPRVRTSPDQPSVLS